MPLVRFAHSCHIFMTTQTRGNILYTTGITLYYTTCVHKVVYITCDFSFMNTFCIKGVYNNSCCALDVFSIHFLRIIYLLNAKARNGSSRKPDFWEILRYMRLILSSVLTASGFLRTAFFFVCDGRRHPSTGPGSQ